MPQTATVCDSSSDIEAFFAPAAVAIFGASRERNKLGSEVLRNLISTGYTGRVIPIHRSAAELQGLRAYPALAAAPVRAEIGRAHV